MRDRSVEESEKTQHLQERNIHVPGGGFEPAIPANERQQTQALDRAAIEIGHKYTVRIIHEFLRLKRMDARCFLRDLKN